MKKYLIVIGITLILLVVGFSGCTDNNASVDRAKFIGTWYIQAAAQIGHSWLYTFYENGSYITYNEGVYTNGTWNVKEGKKLDLYSNNSTMALSYVFSNDDKTISISQVDSQYVSMVLQKQET